MKNIYRYLLIFTASALVVSCGESDLEPTLALDKDLDSGIKSAADLGFVLNSAYDRMSVSGYYGRDQIIMGDVRTDNAYSNMNLVDLLILTWITVQMVLVLGVQFMV